SRAFETSTPCPGKVIQSSLLPVMNITIATSPTENKRFKPLAYIPQLLNYVKMASFRRYVGRTVDHAPCNVTAAGMSLETPANVPLPRSSGDPKALFLCRRPPRTHPPISHNARYTIMFGSARFHAFSQSGVQRKLVEYPGKKVFFPETA